jgi:hypothetical protein
MSEVTIKRICNPGWKNCERPLLMRRITELEAERDSHAIANVNANCTITELEEANAELRRDANVR